MKRSLLVIATILLLVGCIGQPTRGAMTAREVLESHSRENRGQQNIPQSVLLKAEPEEVELQKAPTKVDCANYPELGFPSLVYIRNNGNIQVSDQVDFRSLILIKNERYLQQEMQRAELLICGETDCLMYSFIAEETFDFYPTDQIVLSLNASKRWLDRSVFQNETVWFWLRLFSNKKELTVAYFSRLTDPLEVVLDELSSEGDLVYWPLALVCD